MNYLFTTNNFFISIFSFLLLTAGTAFSQELTYDFKNTLTETGGNGADLNLLGTGNFQTD